MAGPDLPAEVPPEVMEAEKRVKSLIDRMVQAIASHDFKGARCCSYEERKEGQNLRLLREKYGIPPE